MNRAPGRRQERQAASDGTMAGMTAASQIVQTGLPGTAIRAQQRAQGASTCRLVMMGMTRP
jgi:hypothetical protein